MAGDLLARPGIDLGLPTDNEKARRAFYEGLRLPNLMIDHIMDGQDEVYYTVRDSWAEIVTNDQPMPEELSGPLPKANVPPPSAEEFLNFRDFGTPIITVHGH